MVREAHVDRRQARRLSQEGSRQDHWRHRRSHAAGQRRQPPQRPPRSDSQRAGGGQGDPGGGWGGFPERPQAVEDAETAEGRSGGDGQQAESGGSGRSRPQPQQQRYESRSGCRHELSGRSQREPRPQRRVEHERRAPGLRLRRRGAPERPSACQGQAQDRQRPGIAGLPPLRPFDRDSQGPQDQAMEVALPHGSQVSPRHARAVDPHRSFDHGRLRTGVPSSPGDAVIRGYQDGGARSRLHQQPCQRRVAPGEDLPVFPRPPSVPVSRLVGSAEVGHHEVVPVQGVERGLEHPLVRAANGVHVHPARQPGRIEIGPEARAGREGGEPRAAHGGEDPAVRGYGGCEILQERGGRRDRALHQRPDARDGRGDRRLHASGPLAAEPREVRQARYGVPAEAIDQHQQHFSGGRATVPPSRRSPRGLLQEEPAVGDEEHQQNQGRRVSRRGEGAELHGAGRGV